MAGEDIKVIDVMNYYFPDVKQLLNSKEAKQMFGAMFKGGGNLPGIYKGLSPEEFIAEMDRSGFEKVFLCAMKMWSHMDHQLIWDSTIDDTYNLVKKYPDRFVGLASWNPFRIMESLYDVEKAVKEYGFKGVYVHTLGFGVPPNDKRMYPCYAKCMELGIPFAYQAGHSLELMPSDPGRPIYIDDVALDFPELPIIASHTGWPWCEEQIAMAWKHPNVYIDISAHLPRYLDKSLINFMNTRGRGKVMFGTNGLGFKEVKDMFLELGLKEETNQMVLRDNAVRVYKL